MAIKTVFLSLLMTMILLAQQNTTIPAYYKVDPVLTDSLSRIISDMGLGGDFDCGEDGLEQVSLAVIDLCSDPPRIGGYHMENFIYPASVYKMYVAAEILRQVSAGKMALTTLHVVRAPNDVDRSREISFDPRPLLHDRDTVTVNYLLDLMITRSDNSAANCLIDIAGRENINTLIEKYNWQGSEVTRKFLSRKFEDPGYEKIRGTETSGLHAADFMYRVEKNQLVNPWVSMQMKALLARQLDKSKIATGLPDNTMFYHKTGWFAYWTHDVGIVDDGKVRYVIACFLPLSETQALQKHKELSARIFHLMQNYQK
ncbi:MAG: serine hydrolase [Calditrichales bacterium]|nr:MAG: serine hydrolase [Calditrichales bacterium]